MGDKSITNRNTLLVSLLLISLMAISGVHSNSQMTFKNILDSQPDMMQNKLNSGSNQKLKLYKKSRPIVK